MRTVFSGHTHYWSQAGEIYRFSRTTESLCALREKLTEGHTDFGQESPVAEVGRERRRHSGFF